MVLLALIVGIAIGMALERAPLFATCDTCRKFVRTNKLLVGSLHLCADTTKETP